MKKLCLSLIVASGLFTASFVFADNQTTGGYQSGQVKLATPVTAVKSGLKATALNGMLATNIIIINFSNYYLHSKITNIATGQVYIDQPIDPGAPRLFSNNYDGQDRNDRRDRYQILDGNRDLFGFISLCRRAIVTVDGGPDVFHMNVERKYC